MSDPLAVIDQAVRLSRTVTITTADGTTLSGAPLHVGPNSVWLVVANTDVFIPLDAISAAEATVVSPLQPGPFG